MNNKKKETYGYQPLASEKRGYQPKKVNNGYQPPSGIDKIKPPTGGSGAVTPKKND